VPSGRAPDPPRVGDRGEKDGGRDSRPRSGRGNRGGGDGFKSGPASQKQPHQVAHARDRSATDGTKDNAKQGGRGNDGRGRGGGSGRGGKGEGRGIPPSSS
jgi:hypothetical protein